MPLEYRIEKGKKLVYVTGNGVITFSELMDHIEELSRASEYQSPMKKLVDYRTVTRIELSSSQSKAFAAKKGGFKNIFAGETCALVAPSDVVFGTARVHDTLFGFEEADIEMTVFRDLAEALTWLGLDPLDESYGG